MERKYEIDFNDYHFMDEVGEFRGRLDSKMKGKNMNMIANITLTDGRKITAVAYSDTDYLGLRDIEVGSDVIVEFEKSKNGRIRLAEIHGFY